MPKAVQSVRFNDGDSEDLFALVTGGEGDTLDLTYQQEGGAWQIANNVPRREKADYGPEGGGRTWHE